MAVAPLQPRRLFWLGDTHSAIREFPPDVRQKLGFALYLAQTGRRHETAKLLHGFKEHVWQVRADGVEGTYRAVYLARFRDEIYVLSVFQKKSKSGVATPQAEIERIRQRLKTALRMAASKEEI